MQKRSREDGIIFENIMYKYTECFYIKNKCSHKKDTGDKIMNYFTNIQLNCGWEKANIHSFPEENWQDAGAVGEKKRKAFKEYIYLMYRDTCSCRSKNNMTGIVDKLGTYVFPSKRK